MNYSIFSQPHAGILIYKQYGVFCKCRFPYSPIHNLPYPILPFAFALFREIARPPAQKPVQKSIY